MSSHGKNEKDRFDQADWVFAGKGANSLLKPLMRYFGLHDRPNGQSLSTDKSTSGNIEDFSHDCVDCIVSLYSFRVVPAGNTIFVLLAGNITLEIRRTLSF